MHIMLQLISMTVRLCCLRQNTEIQKKTILKNNNK